MQHQSVCQSEDVYCDESLLQTDIRRNISRANEKGAQITMSTSTSNTKKSTTSTEVDEVTILEGNSSTMPVDNLGQGTKMTLPLTLGKSGNPHDAMQYRNANTTEVEAAVGQKRRKIDNYQPTIPQLRLWDLRPWDATVTRRTGQKTGVTMKAFRRRTSGIAVQFRTLIPPSWMRGDTLCTPTGLVSKTDRQLSPDAVGDLAVIKTSKNYKASLIYPMKRGEYTACLPSFGGRGVNKAKDTASPL